MQPDFAKGQFFSFLFTVSLQFAVVFSSVSNTYGGGRGCK